MMILKTLNTGVRIIVGKCLFVFGIMTLSAVPTIAETWECVIGKPMEQMKPSVISIQIDHHTGETIIRDDLLKSWGRELALGQVSADNAKRQTIKWTVDGISLQRLKSHGNAPITKASFSLSRLKKSNKMTLRVKPDGGFNTSFYENEVKWTGKCSKT
jgi:hypothetical protein